MAVVPPNKRCPACKRTLPSWSFRGSALSRADGLKAECRICEVKRPLGGKRPLR